MIENPVECVNEPLSWGDTPYDATVCDRVCDRMDESIVTESDEVCESLDESLEDV